MTDRPRLKLEIRLPKLAPDPPPQVCAICGREHPYWHMTTEKPPVCWDCTAASSRRYGWRGDYRDGRMIDSARAVISKLETEHGRVD